MTDDTEQLDRAGAALDCESACRRVKVTISTWCCTCDGGWPRRCNALMGLLLNEIGDAARISDLAGIGQPVHALRV